MKINRSSLLRYLAQGVSAAFILAIPTAAAADMITLKIPGIPGDVTLASQAGTIEVLSLSSTIVNRVSTGAGIGKAVFNDMIIHKRFDRSSPLLFLALVKGKHYPNALISFLGQNNKGQQTTVFTITLTEISFSKLETDSDENTAGKGQEQINIRYERIELKDEITGQQACWDLAMNKAC